MILRQLQRIWSPVCGWLGHIGAKRCVVLSPMPLIRALERAGISGLEPVKPVPGLHLWWCSACNAYWERHEEVRANDHG